MKHIFFLLLTVIVIQSCVKKESVTIYDSGQDQNTDSASQNTDSTSQQDTVDYFIGNSYINHIMVGGCSGGVPSNSDTIPDSLFVVYHSDDSMQLNANNGSWMYQSNDSGYYQGSGDIPTLILVNDSAFLDVLIATDYCPYWNGQNWVNNQVWTIYNFFGKKED
jgi:hypothetical protein